MFLDYLSIKLMIFSRVSSLLEQSTILFHALSRMKAAALTLTSPMSAILIFGLCSGELWSWLVRIISMMFSRLAALQSQWGVRTEWEERPTWNPGQFPPAVRDQSGAVDDGHQSWAWGGLGQPPVVSLQSLLQTWDQRFITI